MFFFFLSFVSAVTSVRFVIVREKKKRKEEGASFHLREHAFVLSLSFSLASALPSFFFFLPPSFAQCHAAIVLVK